MKEYVTIAAKAEDDFFERKSQFIGYIAPLMRKVLDEKLKKLKHKSDLVMTVICFFLTLMREILYIGYLFLIGSEQSMITVVRALLSAGYSALLITPGFFLMKPLMRVKVIPGRKKKQDLVDDETKTDKA